MKKLNIGLLLAILAILAGLMACNLAKKTKITDIPVTTSSKDALNSVKQGLDLMDQGEILKARALFIKAIEQDPKLAVAYILKSGSSRSLRNLKKIWIMQKLTLREPVIGKKCITIFMKPI